MYPRCEKVVVGDVRIHFIIDKVEKAFEEKNWDFVMQTMVEDNYAKASDDVPCW